MEFFATADVRATAAELQVRLSIAALPRWCASISEVVSDTDVSGEMYCLWGQFRVHREAIRDGVRFTLPDCPNALQWTVTTGQPPEPDKVIIHLTINRTEHDPDFVEANQEFALGWKAGLESHWPR